MPLSYGVVSRSLRGTVDGSNTRPQRKRITMRVTCPKCQFENQADSSRVVCARCATIIEVRPEAGTGGYDYSTNFDDAGFGDSGFENNGLRSTANYSSPYAGGNYGGTGGGNYPPNDFSGGGYGNQNYPTAPVARPSDQDVYATRIDDDFDDVLDIPRSTPPQGYQMNETAPVFEDVFSTPDYGMPRDSGRAADPYQGGMNEQYQGGMSDPYRGGEQDPYRGSNAAEPNFDNPSFGVPSEPEFMGWPVLPEDSTDPGISTSSGFDKKSSLLRLAIIVALAVGGIFILYSLFFSGNSNRAKKAEPVRTAESAGTEKTAADDIAALPNDKTPATEAGAQAPVGPSGASTKPEPDGALTEKSPVTIPPKVLTPEKTTVTKPAETDKTERAEVPSTPNRGNITIQIGSFNDRAQAEDRVSRLTAAGVSARIVSVNIPGRGTWHRVQVGKFVSREQAAGFASQLRGRGLVQDFMVTPVN
jgi:cell division septation protein DedD